MCGYFFAFKLKKITKNDKYYYNRNSGLLRVINSRQLNTPWAVAAI
jgi:hypothetical protein